jgi:hypothetical protein
MHYLQMLFVIVLDLLCKGLIVLVDSLTMPFLIPLVTFNLLFSAVMSSLYLSVGHSSLVLVLHRGIIRQVMKCDII